MSEKKPLEKSEVQKQIRLLKEAKESEGFSCFKGLVEREFVLGLGHLLRKFNSTAEEEKETLYRLRIYLQILDLLPKEMFRLDRVLEDLEKMQSNSFKFLKERSQNRPGWRAKDRVDQKERGVRTMTKYKASKAAMASKKTKAFGSRKMKMKKKK